MTKTGGDAPTRGAQKPRASLFAGQAGHQGQAAPVAAHTEMLAPLPAAPTAPAQAAAHPVYAHPHMMPPQPKIGLMGRLMQSMQALVMFGNILIFAYIFLGEVFLPDHLRATTFLGKRIGGIQGQTAVSAAPQQAEAVSIVDTAKANVEVLKQCDITRRTSSVGIYNQCLGKPGGSHPLCLLEQQMFLDTYQCNAAGEILNIAEPAL